ncbi:peroxiredoxin 1 [Mitosporidium daphniae]
MLGPNKNGLYVLKTHGFCFSAIQPISVFPISLITLAPVCTTEISQLMKEQAKLEALNLYPIGLSVDDLEFHLKWREHLSIFSGLSATDVPPIIADPNGKIASLLGMLDSYDHDPSNVINGIPLTVRSVFVLDHRMSVRAIWTYPASVGRLWSEIFRVVEALQLSEKYPIATPESWTPNSAVLIRANISTEDAMPLLPKDTKVSVPFSDIPYVRFAKL